MLPSPESGGVGADDLCADLLSCGRYTLEFHFFVSGGLRAALHFLIFDDSDSDGLATTAVRTAAIVVPSLLLFSRSIVAVAITVATLGSSFAFAFDESSCDLSDGIPLQAAK